MEKIKVKNKYKVGMIFISILLLFAISLEAFALFHKDDVNVPNIKENNNKDNDNYLQEEVKKIEIVDITSNSRPYAVMINNHPDARAHHAGLQDAYIVYEIIVEGGMTRYMALFKDQETAKIGSVRSSRHYFLDYALENDAIYVHWGWSPKAKSDISSLKINNINGLIYEGVYFYRDKTLKVNLEHTGFTTMEMLQKGVEKLKYRNTTDQRLLLNYTTDEIDLNKLENSKEANEIAIKYSNSVTTSYVYDSEMKVYKRFVNNKEHKDDITKEQYTAKNIIVYDVYNSAITGDGKGRQDFDNIGTGSGYYITNGYAVKINWTKDSRDSQTKYTYLDGTEIDVSDGNTFIQIYPKSGNLTIN